MVEKFALLHYSEVVSRSIALSLRKRKWTLTVEKSTSMRLPSLTN